MICLIFFREKTKTSLLETTRESAKRFLQVKAAKVQNADLLYLYFTEGLALT